MVEELETQLEVQSAIIEAQKSLVEQAKTRQLRKERKKEVKKAEEKYWKIDERLSDVKKTQRRVSNDSRFESPGKDTVMIRGYCDDTRILSDS